MLVAILESSFFLSFLLDIGMSDLPNTWPVMIHPIIMGVYGWTRYFQPTVWETRRLEIGAGRLVHARSRYPPSKGGNSRWGPLILLMPINAHYGIPYKVRPTRKWSNTIIIHAGGNIGAVFLSFLVISWLSMDSHHHDARPMVVFCFECWCHSRGGGSNPKWPHM